ncbi:hypothetical protein [Flexivirga caeni]|uniref:hypothetical protein n=1 Tax=Flexivirga caeni TaxID=2294115 RepID=UPI0011CDC3AC|nr:hypothetical protein [Flexivirga caeni]
MDSSLRTGLEALDGVLVAVRALFSVMSKEAPQESTPDDGYGDQVRAAFAVALHELAEAIRAFGSLVEAEFLQREGEVAHHLAESVDRVREAQAVLAELMFVEARAETSLWLLRGSIPSALATVAAQLDVEERSRRRREWNQSTRILPRPQEVPLLREMLANPAVDRLRARRRAEPRSDHERTEN